MKKETPRERGSSTVLGDVDVLVIEDDFDAAEILRDSLVEAGYEVVVTTNRSSAIEQLNIGLRPGVVIMDLMMPGASAADFATALKRLAIESTPIVIVSAVAQSSLPSPIGCAARMAKPIDLGLLLEIVRSQLGNEGDAIGRAHKGSTVTFH